MITDILLVDQGNAPSNLPEWIACLHPQDLWLSVAAGGKDGTPDRGTFDAVQGYSLPRTNRNGWSELSTDGKQNWVGW